MDKASHLLVGTGTGGTPVLRPSETAGTGSRRRRSQPAFLGDRI
ncbi:hypothetical protein [Kamptonema formosum]|nr:hypothetical protein [Oscillatoria sp. PCC 10802]